MFEDLFRRIKVWQILAAAACLYALGLTGQISVGGDDAAYILLSRDIFKPVEGFYCFLLPVLLAPFSRFAPDNFLLMKAIPFLSAVAGLGIFYRLLCRWMQPARAKLLMLLCAVSPWIVEYSGLILTEMPYLAVSMAALLFLQRYDENGRAKDRWFAALFLVLSVYARHFGIVFIPAVLLFFFLRRRWKDAAFYALVFLFSLAPLLYRSLQVLVRESVLRAQIYSAQYEPVSFVQAVSRMVHTAGTYIGSYLPDILFRSLSEGTVLRQVDGSLNPLIGLKIALGCLLSVLIVIGAARTARRRPTMVHYYLAMHAVLGLAVNAYIARYLVPLMPFLYWFLLEGIGGFSQRQEGSAHALRAARIAVVFLAGISLLNSGIFLWQARVAPAPARISAFVECNRWLKSHAPAQSRVLSRKPAYTTVVSGLPAAGYIFSARADDQVRAIVSQKIDYVIVGDPESVGMSVSGALLEALESRPDLFTRVYVSSAQPADYVYKVKRE